MQAPGESRELFFIIPYMSFPILGLHHVTATVDEAQADLDFAASALGLRLVKKTVNFDNHSVYHFYYGDELGTPGTIWTTFPYMGYGVPPGTRGAGQVTATSFSVPSPSLGFWQTRLKDLGFHVSDATTRFNESALAVTDPSGLNIELVGADTDERKPWIPAESEISLPSAIRGLHSVTMTLVEPEPTIAFMRELLGFQLENQDEDRTRMCVNGGGPGRIIDLLCRPESELAKNGLGTVHHVAMAIENPDDQLRLRRDLTSHGIQVTPVMDRQYFQSIYFREPGGVLFEVATMQPGFTVDEPAKMLGRSLKLPQQAESRRGEIERGLPPITYH